MMVLKHISVLGAGVMGTKIACVLANAGLPVLLLDRLNETISEKEIKLNYNKESKFIRDKIAQTSLEVILNQKPASLYSKTLINNISTGNFIDDIHKISQSDWIIEAVSENIEIKEKVLEWIEKNRKENSIITTNTSGISVNLLAKNKSANFKKYFFGAHFFNPPRNLRLLEIIPTAFTNEDIIVKFKHFAQNNLDRISIVCKDSPAFVGNRIGIFNLLSTCIIAHEFKLSISETDYLTGLLIGKPASATYRTIDIIGIDTFINVVEYLEKNLPNNQFKNYFSTPKILIAMQEKGLLGEKTKSGFYKKILHSNGKTQFLTVNNHLEYETADKTFIAELASIEKIKNLEERIQNLILLNNTYGAFIRKYLSITLAYAAHAIPEISDSYIDIDLAMRNGFGWDKGPFELWDIIGFEKGKRLINEENIHLPKWLQNKSNSFESFYLIKNSQNFLFQFSLGKYETIPFPENYIHLNLYRNSILYSNNAINLIDIGDNVLVCEFITKMNAINYQTLAGINECILIAEKQNKALIIANEGKNFSVGADLLFIHNCIQENQWDEIEKFIDLFQKTSQNIRYSKIPVVIATQHLVLGGACEFCLHADFVQMYAETKIGLVEANVGLLPAGGGTKELILKASDSYELHEIDLYNLKRYYQQITSGVISDSAYHALELNIFDLHKTAISKNIYTLLYDAKKKAIELLNSEYIPPRKKTNIKILGKSALAHFKSSNYNKKCAGYISNHQEEIFNKIAFVMCGGNISEVAYIDEDYLLKLEKEVFMELCADKNTLEKIKNVVLKNS